LRRSPASAVVTRATARRLVLALLAGALAVAVEDAAPDEG
jgi:hypothetical protein